MNKTNSTFTKLIFIFMPFAACFFITSIFRTLNAIQAPLLVRTLHLTTADMAFLSSTYLLAYGLGQLPVGIFLDYYGTKKTQIALMFLGVVGIITFAVGGNTISLASADLFIGFGLAGGLSAALKANNDWFPSSNLAFLNSTILVIGGLGTILSTAPAHIIINAYGWRHTNLGLAGITLLVIFLVIWLVPATATDIDKQKINFVEQIKILKVIYKDKFFWKISPLMIFGAGFFLALQGLWAGEWLRNVNNLSDATTAKFLLVIALGLILGFIGASIFTKIANKFNKSMNTVVIFGAAIMLLFEMLLFDHNIKPNYLLWFGYSFFTQTLTLTFTLVSEYFPKNLTGRATTAINLVNFAGAFVIQNVMGDMIEFWHSLNGGFSLASYETVFWIFIVLQILSLFWFIFFQRKSVPA